MNYYPNFNYIDMYDNFSNDLFEPYEGFIRGNLFDDLYQQYKNYRPRRLVPDNEQAELFFS